MSEAWDIGQILALCAAGLVGIGLYGVVVSVDALRRIIAFNVVGIGVFLFFGAIARRGVGEGFAGDPVPQALIITGIVVAFAATALAVALVMRWRELRAGGLARESKGEGAPITGTPLSHPAGRDACGAGEVQIIDAAASIICTETETGKEGER